MPMRRCDANEHHYDDSKYDACPYCRSTVLVTPAMMAGGEPTVVTAQSAEPAAPAVLPAEPPAAAPAMAAAVSPAAGAAIQSPEVTRNFGADHVMAPVVGWLVVQSAPRTNTGKRQSGRDYRLVVGQNRVGRDPAMEVCIDAADEAVGRDTHCLITFDPESLQFFVQGGTGQHLTHVQSDCGGALGEGVWEIVLQPAPLCSGDQVRVGSTVLRLVPLCTDTFSWNFGES